MPEPASRVCYRNSEVTGKKRLEAKAKAICCCPESLPGQNQAERSSLFRSLLQGSSNFALPSLPPPQFKENLLKQQPWKNCSGPHLQPSWTLSNLMGWDKLEALETVVNLYTRVLQNCSQDMADKKIFEPVLETLIPLGHEFQACIRKKPAGRNESENLSTFKKEFQKFKASNAEQSPKCLEAAVGLDIHRLLKTDIKHPPRLMF
uniref:Uncharacterized protein n=1 Tax=Sphaerodactylus townsendi TaxID=933632 RepID=A0ACB8FSS4_9SAUR